MDSSEAAHRRSLPIKARVEQRQQQQKQSIEPPVAPPNRRTPKRKNAGSTSDTSPSKARSLKTARLNTDPLERAPTATQASNMDSSETQPSKLSAPDSVLNTPIAFNSAVPSIASYLADDVSDASSQGNSSVYNPFDMGKKGSEGSDIIQELNRDIENLTPVYPSVTSSLQKDGGVSGGIDSPPRPQRRDNVGESVNNPHILSPEDQALVDSVFKDGIGKRTIAQPETHTTTLPPPLTVALPDPPSFPTLPLSASDLLTCTHPLAPMVTYPDGQQVCITCHQNATALEALQRRHFVQQSPPSKNRDFRKEDSAWIRKMAIKNWNMMKLVELEDSQLGTQLGHGSDRVREKNNADGDVHIGGDEESYFESGVRALEGEIRNPNTDRHPNHSTLEKTVAMTLTHLNATCSLTQEEIEPAQALVKMAQGQ